MRKTYSKNGFTLVELMIVVAVIGILAAIAYPSYLDHVRKSRRSLAKAALMEAAQKQEAFYARSGKYTATLSDLNYTAVTGTTPPVTEVKSDSGKVYYRMLLESPSATCPLSSCYAITVQAYDDQVNDDIASLRIWSTGRKQYLTQGGTWVDGWPE